MFHVEHNKFMKLDFIDGKAIVKQGKKTIAKVYDRKVYYKVNNIKGSFSEKYPYSLEMKFGVAECESLAKVKELIEKYI